MARERRDNKGRLLLTGEAQIRNGSYTFRYTDENGVRKSITNWKLLPEDQPPKLRPDLHLCGQHLARQRTLQKRQRMTRKRRKPITRT